MYRNLNDYEILYMVEDAQDNIFDILLLKYRPLIYKTAKEYSVTFKKFGYEIDDLMQIGYITLFKALYFYNEYNETMFYTYFKRSLNNSMISLIRNNATKKKEILNNALSYDTEIPNTNLCYIDLFFDNSISHDYSKELIVFKNSMPCLLSWVFELFYNGYSKEEISILLDEGFDNVKKMLTKIKEHALTYKPLFFEEYML